MADLFTHQNYRNIIIDNLDHCQKRKGLEIFAWVMMNNHIHFLVRSEQEKVNDILRNFKSYTSKKIIEEIKSCNESRKDWMLKIFKDSAFKHKQNAVYQFWTNENHAEHIFSNKFIEQKKDYIHNNPVRAGIVQNVKSISIQVQRTTLMKPDYWM